MGNETFEIWIQRPDATWARLVDKESGNDVFEHRKKALAIAGKTVRDDEEVVEAIVIERNVISRLNGVAMLLPPEKKPEPVRKGPEFKLKKHDGGDADGDAVRSTGAAAGDGGHEGQQGGDHGT